jgi:dimethylglycine dehydrogenase
MWELDVRRFGDYARRESFLVPRALDVYRREYAIHYPEEERDAGRPVRTDALHEVLRGRGAVMGFRFGWERPLWFSRDGARDEYSMRRGNWHHAVGEECRAVRSAVGVLDQTSFAKYRVAGPGAEAFLDRLCANSLPALGRIALTQMCRPSGGIECDLTVTRVEPERFYIVSAAATDLHDYAWIESHLPDDGVELRNDTERYGVLTLAGPRSRELLQSLVEEDISREAFPFFHARHLEVGGVPTLTLRLSYVGELGFELHHPIEHLRTLYERLHEAGEPLGLVDFGYRALESLRLEKGYRLWGADMSADWTPLEAGLERFVRFDKGDFVGRDALLRREVRRRLTCLVVDSPGIDPHGYEPVRADRRLIGYVSSAGYGHVVERTIALAYLPVEHAEPGTRLTVDVLGEPRPAEVVREPLWDPPNTRLLG